MVVRLGIWQLGLISAASRKELMNTFVGNPFEPFIEYWHVMATRVARESAVCFWANVGVHVFVVVFFFLVRLKW